MREIGTLHLILLLMRFMFLSVAVVKYLRKRHFLTNHVHKWLYLILSTNRKGMNTVNPTPCIEYCRLWYKILSDLKLNIQEFGKDGVGFQRYKVK